MTCGKSYGAFKATRVSDRTAFFSVLVNRTQAYVTGRTG